VATPPPDGASGACDGARGAYDASFEDVDVMDNGGVDGRVDVTSSEWSLHSSKRDEGVGDCVKDAEEKRVVLNSEEGPLARRGLLERLVGTAGVP
jgi:hypothetical protein